MSTTATATRPTAPRPSAGRHALLTYREAGYPIWLGGPTLTVLDDATGHPIHLPVATVELDGAHYLVSPEGETDWVRDLRRSHEGVLRRGRTGEPFAAEEIRGGEHDRVVDRYRDQMGERTSEPFDELPDPADHPVFRIGPR